MINYNSNYKNYIEEISQRTNFIRNTLEKVDRLLDILEWINSHNTLSNLLALKGGTAINAAIYDFPRLSVDIDLDLTENLLRDEMMEKRKEIYHLIASYLESNNYKINVEKSKSVHALDSIVFEYKDIRGNLDNIKIEINYMNRVHILDTKKVEMNSKIFTNRKFNIHILDSIEIYAAKFCALLSRTTARDLFDVYTLAKDDMFNKEEKKLLKKCFLVQYVAINGYEIKDLDLKKLDKLTMADVKNKLMPTLKERNPKKANIDDMVKEVSKYLKEFLVLNDKEQEFYDEFQKGSFRPELLFDDDEIVQRIKNHPMILWKMQRDE